MVAAPPQPVPPSNWLLPDPDADRDADLRADPDPDAGATDLVGFGADLAPGTLVDAYRRGIFPWPHQRTPLPWFSPDPRAVIMPGGVHVARSLRAHLRRSSWETTVDADFDAVVAGCRHRPHSEGTWITREMARAYRRLHQLGWAHSLEVWDGTELVGGIYGVRVGACFTGESMFHLRTDASKVALVDLVTRWAQAGGAFFDVQLPTDHLASMGAVEVPRAEFLAMLAGARDRLVSVCTDRLPVSRLAVSRPAG